MCLAHDDCARRQFCAFRHNLCHSCLGKNERCNEDAECCGSDKKKRKNICYSARCMSESKVFSFKKFSSFQLGKIFRPDRYAIANKIKRKVVNVEEKAVVARKSKNAKTMAIAKSHSAASLKMGTGAVSQGLAVGR